MFEGAQRSAGVSPADVRLLNRPVNSRTTTGLIRLLHLRVCLLRLVELTLLLALRCLLPLVRVHLVVGRRH